MCFRSCCSAAFLRFRFLRGVAPALRLWQRMSTFTFSCRVSQYPSKQKSVVPSTFFSLRHQERQDICLNLSVFFSLSFFVVKSPLYMIRSHIPQNARGEIPLFLIFNCFSMCFFLCFLEIFLDEALKGSHIPNVYREDDLSSKTPTIND